MTKAQNSKPFFRCVWDIRILNFESVSDFVLGISDFETVKGQAETAFVHEMATVIGDVQIGEHSSIG